MAQRRLALSFSFILSAFLALPMEGAMAMHIQEGLTRGDENYNQAGAATALDQINATTHSTGFSTDYNQLLSQASSDRAGALESLSSLLPTTALAASKAVEQAAKAKETSIMDHLRDLRHALIGGSETNTQIISDSASPLTVDARIAREAARVSRMYDPALYATKSGKTPSNPADLYPGQPLGGSTMSLIRPAGTQRVQMANTSLGTSAHYAMADTPLFSGSKTNLNTHAVVSGSSSTTLSTSTGADSGELARPSARAQMLPAAEPQSLDAFVPAQAPAPQPMAAAPAPASASGAPVYGAVAVPISDNAASSSGAIDPERRWGVFATSSTLFGQQKIVKQAASADTTEAGLTLGVDYRLNRDSFVGLAFSYAHDSFTIQDRSDLDGDSYGLSLYGTTSYMKNAYADGFISMGYHSFDSERSVHDGLSPVQLAKGSPDGMSVSGRAETGYEFDENGWKYGPFAGMSLLYSDFGSWSETGAGPLSLKVDDLSSFSTVANIGAGATKRFSMGSSGSIAPQLRMAYNRRIGPDHASVNAAFAENGAYVFRTQGEEYGRDWISLAPSITASLPHSWMLQASYEHDFFRYDQSEHLFNVAARYNF